MFQSSRMLSHTEWLLPAAHSVLMKHSLSADTQNPAFCIRSEYVWWVHPYFGISLWSYTGISSTHSVSTLLLNAMTHYPLSLFVKRLPSTAQNKSPPEPPLTAKPKQTWSSFTKIILAHPDCLRLNVEKKWRKKEDVKRDKASSYIEQWSHRMLCEPL